METALDRYNQAWDKWFEEFFRAHPIARIVSSQPHCLLSGMYRMVDGCKVRHLGNEVVLEFANGTKLSIVSENENAQMEVIEERA